MISRKFDGHSPISGVGIFNLFLVFKLVRVDFYQLFTVVLEDICYVVLAFILVTYRVLIVSRVDLPYYNYQQYLSWTYLGEYQRFFSQFDLDVLFRQI